MDNFYSALAIGKHGEQLVKTALEARQHTVIDVSDDWEYRRKDIDFILINKEKQKTTIEIKNDVASERTGNFFIEIRNSNNKSHNYDGWLHYTEAEYICFLQEHNKKAFIVSLGELKENIAANSYKKANGSNSIGFLMPVSALMALPSYFQLELGVQ